MNDKQHREDIVRYWWSKAEESLESAKREIKAGAFPYAINRVYYAAFYGVSALLLERQLSFKKHSGVRAAFHREFIKPELLSVEWGKFYDQLFEDRQEGDYIALTSFDKKYVKSKLDQCNRFLRELKVLCSMLSGE